MLRVMSFNIQGTWPKEGPNSWTNRAPLIVALLLSQSPDLIGLQEAQAGNIEYLRRHLPGYTLLPGNCYGNTPPNEYNAILYKRERFELLETGEFWFSPTPDEQSTGNGVDYPMGATWVKLLERQSGSPLLFLNTHFEDGPDGAESRREGARLIIDRMRERSGGELPVIATGDFNWNPDGEAHRLFEAAGYVDTFLAAGNTDGVESTIHCFEGPAYDARKYSNGANTYWRIDWVLVQPGARRVEVEACTIVKDAQPPTYPSDHYPVVADLRMK